jgi:hypothetical protein
MDRMEILKLAISASKDAKEALTLAREMAAFVQEDKALTMIKEALPMPHFVPERRGGAKARLHWNEEDLKKAAALLDNGASYDYVAKILGRTVEAIRSARSKGNLPVKVHQTNEKYRTRAAFTALKRGQKLSEESLELLTRPSP